MFSAALGFALLFFSTVLLGGIGAQTDVAPIPALALPGAAWIWTGEGPNIPGPRAFRKHIPGGNAPAVCLTIAIACDDAYTLWVNGKWIGDNIRKGGDPGGSAFRELDIYSVALGGSNNVIAVNATNVINVDGLIATAVVSYADGSQTVFTTDASWLTAGSAAPPSGFQTVAFNDKSWSTAVVLGGIDTAPWAPLRLGPAPARGNCPIIGGNGGGPIVIPLPNCPLLPPLILPPGSKSPYWEIRNTIDCEIRRLEEALWLCQKEKQGVIDQLVIIIQQIGSFGGGGGAGQFCQLLNCEQRGGGGIIVGGGGTILHEQVD